MDTCSSDVATIMTALSSILLVVSEILPYVTKVKGNGIVEVISEAIIKYLQKPKSIEETSLREDNVV
jgi:hypothetical protein